jgi:hypothetical protein
MKLENYGSINWPVEKELLNVFRLKTGGMTKTDSCELWIRTNQPDSAAMII